MPRLGRFLFHSLRLGSMPGPRIHGRPSEGLSAVGGSALTVARRQEPFAVVQVLLKSSSDQAGEVLISLGLAMLQHLL